MTWNSNAVRLRKKPRLGPRFLRNRIRVVPGEWPAIRTLCKCSPFFRLYCFRVQLDDSLMTAPINTIQAQSQNPQKLRTQGVQPERCQPHPLNISGDPFIPSRLFPPRFADYLSHWRTMVINCRKTARHLLRAGSHKSSARRAKKFRFAFFACMPVKDRTPFKHSTYRHAAIQSLSQYACMGTRKPGGRSIWSPYLKTRSFFVATGCNPSSYPLWKQSQTDRRQKNRIW